jgi:hypothetical protein
MLVSAIVLSGMVSVVVVVVVVVLVDASSAF